MSANIPYVFSGDWEREVAALPPCERYDCFPNRLTAWVEVRFAGMSLHERQALVNLLQGVADAAVDYGYKQRAARENRTDAADGANEGGAE